MSYQRLQEEQKIQSQEIEVKEKSESNVTGTQRRQRKGKSLIGTLSQQLNTEIEQAKFTQSLLEPQQADNQSINRQENSSLVIINYFYDMKKDLKQNFEANIQNKMTVQEIIIGSIQYFRSNIFKLTGQDMPIDPSCYILRAANKKTGKPKTDWPPFDPNTLLSASGFTHFTLCLKEKQKKPIVEQINPNDMPTFDPDTTIQIDQEIEKVLKSSRDININRPTQFSPEVKSPQQKSCCQKFLGFFKSNKT